MALLEGIGFIYMWNEGVMRLKCFCLFIMEKWMVWWGRVGLLASLFTIVVYMDFENLCGRQGFSLNHYHLIGIVQ
jgi:hypothetical protein